MLEKPLIREAKPLDAHHLLKIYRPYVESSPVSFEYELPSLASFQERIEETLKKYPYLVAEENGIPIGYTYAGPFRSRCAYDWSVEVTVYLCSSHHKRGIGRALYHELFQILRKQGIVNIFAGITQPNLASVKLHESLGFKKIGHYQNIGYKLGKWWDVGRWQLQLQEIEKPRELIPYSQLND